MRAFVTVNLLIERFIIINECITPAPTGVNNPSVVIPAAQTLCGLINH